MALTSEDVKQQMKTRAPTRRLRRLGPFIWRQSASPLRRSCRHSGILFKPLQQQYKLSTHRSGVPDLSHINNRLHCRITSMIRLKAIELCCTQTALVWLLATLYNGTGFFVFGLVVGATIRDRDGWLLVASYILFSVKTV